MIGDQDMGPEVVSDHAVHINHCHYALSSESGS